MGDRQYDECQTTVSAAATTSADHIQSSKANHFSRLLTLAGLFLGYLTFLLLGPAIYWWLRRMLPEDRLYWTLGGIGYLSRNLSLVAVALLMFWAVLGRGSLLRRVGVTILGGIWIWIAYFAGLMLVNRIRSDTAVALVAFGLCIAAAAGVLRAFTGWRITTPLDGDSSGKAAWQFQLRDVLLGMTVLGATLAIFLRLPGDILGFFPVALRYYMHISFWEDTFWNYLVPLPIVLACLPAPRLGRRIVALALLVTLLLILVEPILYFLVIDPDHSPLQHGRYRTGLHFFSVQRLALAVLCLATVAILRRIGFRLETGGKIPPPAANHSQG